MFTVLLPLAFLASAMAVQAPVDSTATVIFPVPIADVDYKKVALPAVPTFAPEVFDKKPIEFYVKECYERCETAYKKTDPDYSYCLIGCTVGGQKPKEKLGAVPSPIAVSAREARGFDYCANKYCIVLVLFPPAFGSCIAVCMAAGGRRRSIEYPQYEMTPVTDADYKKLSVPFVPTFAPEVFDEKPVEFYVKECYERCETAYKKTDPDYSYCRIGCTLGGQKLKEKVGAVPAQVAVSAREARGYESCFRGPCRAVSGFFPAFGPCMAVCLASGGRRRSIEYPLGEVTPVTDVDYKKLAVPTFAPEVFDKKPIEFYVKECYERCESAYKKTDPDYSYCLIGCTVGGQKPKEKVAVVGVLPIAPVRE